MMQGAASRPRVVIAAMALAGAAAFPVQAAGEAVHHTVQWGQTLYAIARAYGVRLDAIARANDLKDPALIHAGSRLLIPGARPAAFGPPAGLGRSLHWPLEGRVLSGFHAPRDGHLHQGIDIKAAEGAHVRAAAGGVVRMAAESFGEHGRIVAVEHDGSVTTYYSHNSMNLVEPGRRVRAGEVIALVGRSGNASGPHLHFEVHVKGRPMDPLQVLRADAAVAAPPRDPARRRDEGSAPRRGTGPADAQADGGGPE